MVFTGGLPVSWLVGEGVSAAAVWSGSLAWTMEAFKTRVMATEVNGMTIREWERLFRSKDEARIKRILDERLGVTEGDADELLE